MLNSPAKPPTQLEVQFMAEPATALGAAHPLPQDRQRMRLEQTQLEGVHRRIQADGEHCLLLALPCGRDANDVRAQTHALKNSLVSRSLTFRHRQLTSNDNRLGLSSTSSLPAPSPRAISLVWPQTCSAVPPTTATS